MFVITGGGSGLGRALSKELASRGKKVLIVGRRESTLSITAGYSPLISMLCADIATSEGRRMVAERLQDNEHIDGLVHNAGCIDPIMPITAIDEVSWEKTMATNLHAPLFLSQLLFDKLRSGRVLHIGSGAAHFPVAGWAAYCVSKAALAMLTRCWQLETTGPVFASVKPGIIDTDMQAFIRQSTGMDKEKIVFFNELKQENRLLTPETVALFLAWLLLEVNRDEYSAQEWDIYEAHHHHLWLVKPHVVPHWE